MGSKQDEHVWDVLVVDDMPQLGGLVEQYVKLVDFSCKVRKAATLFEAEYEVKFRRPDLLLLDLHMPHDKWKPPSPEFMKGVDTTTTLAFCRRVVADPALAGVVIVMVSVENQVEELGKKAGAHLFFNKYSFTVEVFEKLLNRLHLRRMQREGQ